MDGAYTSSLLKYATRGAHTHTHAHTVSAHALTVGDAPLPPAAQGAQGRSPERHGRGRTCPRLGHIREGSPDSFQQGEALDVQGEGGGRGGGILQSNRTRTGAGKQHKNSLFPRIVVVAREPMS